MKTLLYLIIVLMAVAPTPSARSQGSALPPKKSASSPSFVIASGQADLIATVVTGHYVDLPVTTDPWRLSPASGVMLARVRPGFPTVNWNGSVFVDPTYGNNNLLLPSDSLRVSAAAQPVGSTLMIAATDATTGAPFQILVTVQDSQAQIVTLRRQDASPTSAVLVHWEADFDNPVTGLQPENFVFSNNGYLAPGPVVLSVDPIPGGENRRYLVTVQLGGYGAGTLTLRYNGYIQETPAVWNVLDGDSYAVDTSHLGVAPGGSVDILAIQDWAFTTGPTAGATMSRLGSDHISEYAWGSSGFFYSGPDYRTNIVYGGEYLRLYANAVPDGSYISVPNTTIVARVLTPSAQVVSINTLDPSVTASSSVRWEVTFDKAVENVSTGSFNFINNSTIKPAPKIIGLVPTPGTGNVKWIVTASTLGTGLGNVFLRWLGHTTESPSVPYSFVGYAYIFSPYPFVVQDVQPGPYYVPVGGAQPTLSVYCLDRTGEEIHYQWRTATTPGAQSTTDIPNAWDTTYTPPVTSVPGTHYYLCRGYTNFETGYYCDSAVATVIVAAPPAITQQPAAKVFTASGTPVSVTVAATGYQLRYQWYEGQPGDKSKPVDGATTASFTIANPTSAKTYWVGVSNALGDSFDQVSTAVSVVVVKRIRLNASVVNAIVDSTISGVTAQAFDPSDAVISEAPITFTINQAGVVGGTVPGGSFSGRTTVPGTTTANAATDANGLATMPPLWTDTKAGPYQLTAGLSPLLVNLSINNLPGAPGKFVVLNAPSPTAIAGVRFAAQPQLQLQDVWSNSITSSGLYATASQNHGTSTLQGTTTVASVNGQINFSDLSYNAAESFELVITCGAAKYTSATIKVSAAPVAAVAVVSGSGQGTTPGTAFATPLRARTVDAYGNVVGNIAVTFTVPDRGASATLSAYTLTSGSDGVVVTSATANATAGSYTVTANLTPAGTAALFTLSNLTSLDLWRAANFNGNFQNSGAGADDAMPFGDGVPNLIKYALNLNAKGPDCSPMTAGGSKGLPLMGIDQNGRLTLTYVRRKDTLTSGITYQLQFSDGPTGFAVNPSAKTSTPVSIDTTWERVTVTDSVPTGLQTRRFARLLITDP